MTIFHNNSLKRGKQVDFSGNSIKNIKKFISQATNDWNEL